MKKFIALIFVVLFLISLCACNIEAKQKETVSADTSVENQKPDKTETLISTEKGQNSSVNKEQAQTAYFFMGSLFLGSYDKSGWHSLCDTTGIYEAKKGNGKEFYAKELLAIPKYHIYLENKYLCDADSLIWYTERANQLSAFEDESAPKKFSKYGQLYHFEGNSDTLHRIFKLPSTLGDELSDLLIPNYSFQTVFAVDNNYVKQDNRRNFATNSDNVKFLSVGSCSEEETKEAKKVLLKLFAEEKMGNTIPNFVEKIKGDFDGDGKDEYIFVANTPNPKENNYWPIIEGEGTKDNVGTFSVLLYQDNDGSIQILHKDLRRWKNGTVTFKNGFFAPGNIDYCDRIQISQIADLNNDGFFEIIVDVVRWEGGCIEAFTQNNKGLYEVVLRSNYGT